MTIPASFFKPYRTPVVDRADAVLQRHPMKRPDKKPVAVDELASRVELLRRAFDRFFQGIDRVPPNPDREQLSRELNRARTRRDLKATDRFRLQQVQQRLNSYARLWDRQLREIEAGTFRPHRARLDRQRTTKPPNKDEQTFKDYAARCAAAGMAQPTRSEFLEKLNSKRQALEAKHGISVAFEVHDKEGRPTLRVRRLDEVK